MQLNKKKNPKTIINKKIKKMKKRVINSLEKPILELKLKISTKNKKKKKIIKKIRNSITKYK